MGKILITGPGRSGTTFLVQLLTRLGFDTGWTPENETYVPDVRAGCEWHCSFNTELETPAVIRARIEAAPRVLKSPDWALVLKWLLSKGIIDVDHVLLPVRDLDTAARSRIAAGLDWGVDPEVQGWQREQDQANILALALGRAVEACLLFEVPCTLLRFPMLVQSAPYLFHKLRPILGDVTVEEFWTTWQTLAQPGQIQTT